MARTWNTKTRFLPDDIKVVRLSEVLKGMETKTMAEVARDYGSTTSTVHNFLARNGYKFERTMKGPTTSE